MVKGLAIDREAVAHPFEQVGVLVTADPLDAKDQGVHTCTYPVDGMERVFPDPHDGEEVLHRGPGTEIPVVDEPLEEFPGLFLGQIGLQEQAIKRLEVSLEEGLNNPAYGDNDKLEMGRKKENLLYWKA